jgi:hypothetical protein
MTKALLKEKILEAERLLAIAEEDLTGAMGALKTAPRSNKMIVSETVQDAFDKLRAARAEVAKLVTLVDEEIEGDT